MIYRYVSEHTMTGRRILNITTTDNMVWQFLLPHIKHLQENGNTVECACNETGFWFNDLVENHDLTVHKICFARNPLHPKNFKAKKELYKLVKNGNYDLIICHTPVGGFMGRKVAHRFGIPVIYIAHGFHFYKGCPLINKLVYKTIEKHYAKYTDALVTINEEDYQAAQKMKAKRVYKINGIGYDPTKNKDYPFDEKALKEELGITKDDIVLIMVGELSKRKNQKCIIDAVSKIENRNLKLLICGQGTREKEYKKHIKKLGIENNVKLLGYRKDVRNIMKISDVYVMPSIQEGLPMGMMEAMEEGLPIIASDIRGNRDLIIHGMNGLLVDLKQSSGFVNVIESLVRNKDLRVLMGDENKKSIQKYYINEVLRQMDNIYKGINDERNN